MIMDRIIEATANRIAKLPDDISTAVPGKERNFSLYQALERVDGRNAIISEIKFASPSRGVIRQGDDPVALARMLVSAGCCALSILTEPVFFHGSTELIPSIRPHVNVPILRKDFIIDERQLEETRYLGADAVLLIAGILGKRLGGFVDASINLGLEPLVEVHSEKEIRAALDTDTQMIGINNRNLHDFTIQLSTTHRLAPLVRRAGRKVVAESGIIWPFDVKNLRQSVDGFLIGSSVMASRNPIRRLEGFVFA